MRHLLQFQPTTSAQLPLPSSTAAAQLPLPSSTTATSGVDPPETLAVDSDVVVILAALLCALICILGLALIARCTFLRNRRHQPSSGDGETPPVHAPPLPPPLPNRGLKKKAIKALPKVPYGGEREFEECAICLEKFKEGEEVRVLPQCGHGFHAGCVDTWLRAHSSCPFCRRICVAAPPQSRCKECGGAAARKAAEGSDSASSFLP